VDEVNRPRRGRRGIPIGFSHEKNKTKQRDHQEDPNGGGRIILKLILWKRHGKIQT
jgi:hypothetical protein